MNRFTGAVLLKRYLALPIEWRCFVRGRLNIDSGWFASVDYRDHLFQENMGRFDGMNEIQLKEHSWPKVAAKIDEALIRAETFLGVYQ